MGPIDYTAGFTDPAQSLLSGIQSGFQMRQTQNQLAAQDLAIQQQKDAQQKQQEMQQYLGNLLSNPNAGPKDFAKATVMFPQLREQFKQAADMYHSEQSQGEKTIARQAFAALNTGRADVAAKLYKDRADQLRATGAPESSIKDAEFWANSIEQAPDATKGIANLLMAGVDPDYVKSFGEARTTARADEKQPLEIQKLGAEASTAQTTAKYAEPKAISDLAEQGWKVENIKSEIGYRKEANRIAAMNAAANNESNDLKRQELKLKIKETEQALSDKAQEKVATVESATSTIDNLVNTVDRLLQNPKLDSVIGSIEGRLPVIFSDKASDAVALIDTVGSQAFVSQVASMKGLGALSDAEGKKLQSSIQSLSRTQSEGQFRSNLEEVQRLMLKARKNVQTKYGVKAPPPDTPAVQTSPSDIDALVKKYGG